MRLPRRTYWRDVGPFVFQYDGIGGGTWRTLVGIEQCRFYDQTGYWLRCWRFGIGVYFKCEGAAKGAK